MLKIFITLIIILFGGLTGLAVREVGYWGVFEYQLNTYSGMQVLADLCISISFALYWMKEDAAKNKRLFYPWFVFTLIAGSFGPLLYFLVGLFKNKKMV